MPHGFWGCHFAKGGAVIPREFYSGVPNSAGCHILCDTGSINSVIFDSLTAALIRQTALHAKGSAGPSGLDSHAWRQICSLYGKASDDICTQLAALGRLLSTHSVDPVSLSPLVACLLVALDKNPGVRPIGVGEVIRRIVTKAILRVIQRLVEEACGILQTCSGLPCGIEAAVHAMREVYAANSTEGILLVDATNAFNSLNREAALHNIHISACYQHPGLQYLRRSSPTFCFWRR